MDLYKDTKDKSAIPQWPMVMESIHLTGTRPIVGEPPTLGTVRDFSPLETVYLVLLRLF